MNVVRASNRVVRALSIEMILVDDIFESENVSVEEGISMSKRQIMAKKVLQATEYVAKKKANCLCFGRFYEPRLPKKLLKTK
ncbi:cyclic lactone autoinducer peptide [Pseudobutyrivibrio sp. UC1225]|nr:cyclic lactone autoinducer peptide [Pseudobutyrivibrio sp. UC1225]